MSKRDIKSISVLVLPVIYLIIYKLFLFDKFMEFIDVINGGFLAILLAISISLLGFRKDKQSVLKRDIFKITILYIGFTFLIMYGLGFFTGFMKNAYSLKIGTLLDNVVPVFCIIVLTELYRYTLLSANSDKKVYQILTFVVIALFELCISIRSIPLNNPKEMFYLLTTMILPIIIKNFSLNYITCNYGYRVPLLYRLIMDLYLFIVPLVPNLGDYVNCIILIILPMLIYMAAITYMDEHLNGVEKVFVRDGVKWYDFPIGICVVLFVCLISGSFKYSLIGVGSESMNPDICKGDAVFLSRVDDASDFKVGDVVAFEKEDFIVVHRVVAIEEDENGNTVYRTKGDANNAMDVKPIRLKQIKAKVVFKVKYIAYPTVWLSELFNKR